MMIKIYEYLVIHSPFGNKTCRSIAEEICYMKYPYNLGRVQDILLKYFGGEDMYAYETSYELARGIVRVMR